MSGIVETSGTRNSIKSKPAGLRRFRHFARIVKGQLPWMKSLCEDTTELFQPIVIDSREGTPENHSQLESPRKCFNVDDFKRNVQTRVDLSAWNKAILSKHSLSRTENDLDDLKWLTRSLKCFEQYSPFVLRELSRVLYYEAYEKGRVVVKQGDPGWSFYFVVVGTVNVEVTEKDPVSGESRCHVVGELHAGSSFGEIALIHDAKRKASIVCRTPSQFLRLEKSDFDNEQQQQINTRLAYLRKQPKFENWTDADLAMAAETSKVVEFKPESMVLNNVRHILDDIFFIIKGECSLARNIDIDYQLQADNSYRIMKPSLRTVYEASTFVRDTPSADNLSDVASHTSSQSGEDKPTLVSHDSTVSKNGGSLYDGSRSTLSPAKRGKLITAKSLVQLRILRPGDFFGVGEDLRNSCIVTLSKVECLVVSRLVFIKHDRSITLDSMTQEANSLMPTPTAVYQRLVEKDRWQTYKKQVLSHVIRQRSSRKNTTHASIQDAPGCLSHRMLPSELHPGREVFREETPQLQSYNTLSSLV
ncbi:uncharacterized protein LOC134195480 [Corticium candelabrum]|uniref:uncharacterized protein LOC134195480 n=1 Tax=Corticium candelabrum TaxID=121492 RepID=UPI002E25E4D6|nr:uncharacterized protein LOC134195480 [Corticium candelabrum]